MPVWVYALLVLQLSYDVLSGIASYRHTEAYLNHLIYLHGRDEAVR